MKKLLYLLVFVAVFTSQNIAQNSSATVKNVNAVQLGQTLQVTYEVSDIKSSESYYVWLEVYDDRNSKRVVKNVTGDIGKINPEGTKSIMWDIDKDLANFDGMVSAKVCAKVIPQNLNKVNIPKNLLYPGSGYEPQKKKRGFNTYLLAGVSIVSNITTNIFYDAYTKSSSKTWANTYFFTCQHFQSYNSCICRWFYSYLGH